MMDGQDPQFENERRLILAILLSGAVLFLTPYIFRYFYPAAETPIPAETQQVEAPATPEPVTTPTSSPPATEAEAQEPEAATEEIEPTSAEAREITVENRDLILRFSSVGAVPVSIRLKEYRDDEGNPLELIPQSLPEGIAPPLALQVFDETVSSELAGAVFEVEGIGSGSTLRAPADLTFHYRRGRVEVRRVYRVPEAGFLVPTTTELQLDRTPVPHRVHLGPGIGPEVGSAGGGWLVATGDFAFPQLAYRLDGSVERVSSVEETQNLAVRPEWVAFDSQYFSYVLMSPRIQQLQIKGETWTQANEEGEPEETILLSANVELAPGSAAEYYFGPKDLEILRQIEPSLGELVDFGFFGILVEPLLFALKAIHGIVGNYGWSIIILTFFINLILVPIRYKQTVSMKKMSELQPQMKAIQNRYKKLDRTDPKRQEMNKEIMELYQQHGVNPLGGCLPLLVQMPFLFAFYRMLAGAIELREAPFIFWIADLSRPDPLYITPIVMGATMVAQQQIMPSTGDSTQRRMMMIMPIVFTYFFLSVSSGLAIYFLFSNVFGMLFQVGMQKMQKEEEIKPSSKPKGPSKKGKAKKR